MVGKEIAAHGAPPVRLLDGRPGDDDDRFTWTQLAADALEELLRLGMAVGPAQPGPLAMGGEAGRMAEQAIRARQADAQDQGADQPRHRRGESTRFGGPVSRARPGARGVAHHDLYVYETSTNARAWPSGSLVLPPSPPSACG